MGMEATAIEYWAGDGAVATISVWLSFPPCAKSHTIEYKTMDHPFWYRDVLAVGNGRSWASLVGCHTFMLMLMYMYESA